MGFWPRMQITPEEGRYSSKYEEGPNSSKQRVLRRFYTNELNITQQLRIDAVQFQISRRCRVFGLTAAGDLSSFLIELIDSTGEQYTAGPIHLVNLLGGWGPDPLSEDGISFASGFSTAVATVRDNGPFIQDPNIVLAPNQALAINAYPADPSDVTTALRVEITLHVYEFPGMPGSPL